MSDNLYALRLHWDGRRGVAKWWGTTVSLAQPPVIGGAPVHEIEYTPEIDVRQIRRRACDPRETMTDADVADAKALVLELAGG